jgi:hypothetical protein
MMTAPPIEVRIAETRTAADVVITVRRLGAYLLRPYRVYLFDDSGRVVELAEFASAAGAAHHHEQLCKKAAMT